MKKEFFLVVIFVLGTCLSCSLVFKKYTIKKDITVYNVKYAGVRSSRYGIRPFPGPEGWQSALEKMKTRFEGSDACAIWIVGTMRGKRTCGLEFPLEGEPDSNIVFLDYDKHEPYLQHFDTTGVRVFLQVEPANADMFRLIDLVLNRYKHHKCVAGFGVDVEWYREADNPDWSVKVSDELAELWEQRVKSINPAYRLFLKHWDRDWMPPSYRGDLIFVDDSQGMKNFNGMMDEFVKYWADYFKPNMVFFQYGYRRDRSWWEKLDFPPGEIGSAVAQNISQDCGVFWVDFTLRDVLPVGE